MLQKMRKIELEFRDVLLGYVSGSPEVVYKEHIMMQTPPRPSFAHVYERERWEENRFRDLYCDGEFMATMCRNPHLVITLIPQKEKLHFVSKILERVIYEHIPQARVVYNEELPKPKKSTVQESLYTYINNMRFEPGTRFVTYSYASSVNSSVNTSVDMGEHDE